MDFEACWIWCKQSGFFHFNIRHDERKYVHFKDYYLSRTWLDYNVYTNLFQIILFLLHYKIVNHIYN